MIIKYNKLNRKIKGKMIFYIKINKKLSNKQQYKILLVIH